MSYDINIQKAVCLDASENAHKHSSFSSFTFDGDDLCSCTFDCDLPIFVLLDNQTQQCSLHVYIELGPPSRHWNGKIQLQLNLGSNSIRSRLIEDDFETALVDLTSLLPENVYVKSCFYCAFSDYSPSGKDAFGDMACHRNNKQQYLAVQTKLDYFSVPVTEIVQETYLCPEFQKRVKGTGYRG